MKIVIYCGGGGGGVWGGDYALVEGGVLGGFFPGGENKQILG